MQFFSSEEKSDRKTDWLLYTFIINSFGHCYIFYVNTILCSSSTMLWSFAFLTKVFFFWIENASEKGLRRSERRT